MGHLKIIAGHLQIHKLPPRNLGVEKIEFSKKLDAAKVFTKYGFGGQWEVSKDATYLVRRHGKWYIGDGKEVRMMLRK